MGNIIKRHEKSTKRVFYSGDSLSAMLSDSPLSASLTYFPENPSKYSFLSDIYSLQEIEDEEFDPYVIVKKHLTVQTLEGAFLIFEILKRQMGDICADLHSGTLNVSEQIMKQFASYYDLEITNFMSVSALPTIRKVSKKIMAHTVKMLFIHDQILSCFRGGENGKALDLIKQLVVSHAVKGITCVEFKMMDSIIINYVTMNNITTEEIINTFIFYLNTFSTLLSYFYETQSSRYAMREKLTREKTSDRDNKARENYRLLKKWKVLVENLNNQDLYVETLLNKINENVKVKPQKMRECFSFMQKRSFDSPFEIDSD